MLSKDINERKGNMRGRGQNNVRVSSIDIIKAAKMEKDNFGGQKNSVFI